MDHEKCGLRQVSGLVRCSREGCAITWRFCRGAVRTSKRVSLSSKREETRQGGCVISVWTTINRARYQVPPKSKRAEPGNSGLGEIVGSTPPTSLLSCSFGSFSLLPRALTAALLLAFPSILASILPAIPSCPPSFKPLQKEMLETPRKKHHLRQSNSTIVPSRRHPHP